MILLACVLQPGPSVLGEDNAGLQVGVLLQLQAVALCQSEMGSDGRAASKQPTQRCNTCSANERHRIFAEATAFFGCGIRLRFRWPPGRQLWNERAKAWRQVKCTAWMISNDRKRPCSCLKISPHPRGSSRQCCVMTHMQKLTSNCHLGSGWSATGSSGSHQPR